MSDPWRNIHRPLDHGENATVPRIGADMSEEEKLLADFDDWLAGWKRAFGKKQRFHDVAALARIGAAVKWRIPTSIDLASGKQFIIRRKMEMHPENYFYDLATWRDWDDNPPCWHNGDVRSCDNEGVEVIPLSALPTPKEKI